ncbi:hypothetical protein GOBAR_DD16927 [Gossypium barbadense]|nr:hypothetical protein GOBAR_DD16927 [Gossypium barbadense]
MLQWAAKILANLIVMGSGILARAVVQAYRQALSNGLSSFFNRSAFYIEVAAVVALAILDKFVVDATKSGVTHETLQNAVRRGGKVMTEQEARLILGKYEILFEKNAKNGSFYLQSKVHRAKECLESVYQGKAEGNPPS